MGAQLLTSAVFGSLGPGCSLCPERELPHLVPTAWLGLNVPLNFTVLPLGRFRLVAYSSPLNSQVSFTI